MNRLYLEITLGIGLAGTGILGGVALAQSIRTRKELKKFNSAIDMMADNVDIAVSEVVIKEAARRAADKETARVTPSIVSNTVRAIVADEKENLSESVKTEIEKQINMLDISDIKKEVARDLAVTVFNKGISTNFNIDTAGIISACKEAGITNPWEVESIIKTVKGEVI